ncbi:MAG TPA: dienelactone hydrolase family protein [Cyclobacteriaceae bacterium]|nr:dienelactone hydrolase family protein [Cyclobacteriaceae bacterium]
MKRLIAFTAAVLLTSSGFTQEITQCHTPAIEKFAMFASIKDFNNEHQTPLEYTHVSEEGGEMIKFKTPDGVEANGFFIAAKKKGNNWILVFQEWWGLNDNIKRQAEMLYQDLGNVNVLAVDMYDGKVTADRQEAGKMMQEFKMTRGESIIKGAIAYAGSKAKIGTIGWCFGGGLSLQASLIAANQAAACVMYYGMPEDNVEKLKTLNCDVLNIFAAKDKRINQDVITKFEGNMKAAGKNLTVKKYDADHGFANPSNPIFDKDATEDAYKNSVDFFKTRLK